MPTLSHRIRGLFAALAAVVALSFSAPSGATAFQVTFDPVAELYGTATFTLTDPCLLHDGTFTDFLGMTAAGCVVSLLDARISINGIGGPYTDYIAILPLVFYSTLVIANHQLLGLTTWPIPIFLATAGSSLSASVTGGWFQCIPSIAFVAPTNNDPTTGSVTFNGCGPNGPLEPLSGNVVSIAQVPEPGTLALLLGGLLALWPIGRRLQARRTRAA